VMYPDDEYYYVDDETAYCPRIQTDALFYDCLDEHKIKPDIKDKENEDYLKCLKNFTKRHKECKESTQWSKLILQRHLTKTRPYKCDKYNYVFMLNMDESNFRKPSNKCGRPFVLQRIADSNLVLLIKNSDCEKYSEESGNFEEKPKAFFSNHTALFCEKLSRPLHRRHSKYCFSHHRDVSLHFT
jgi:hypothetical protein